VPITAAWRASRWDRSTAPGATSVRPAIFDRNVLPFDVTGLGECFPERGHNVGPIGGGGGVDACRQIGPIRIKAKFEQGEDIFPKRRSLFFKKMQIVRGCDVQRNVLVYMVYSDRLIEGSPKNSTSTVPIMPWGATDQVQRCADFVEN
jgi:hypothetical protein